MVARRVLVLCLITALTPWPALAGGQPAAPAVERVFRLTGTLPGAVGAAATVVVAVYASESGGEALWRETQPVALDPAGQFVVFAGAATGGLPTDLFGTGAPRWLAVETVQGQPLQSRVLLTSVPYAVHAASAGDAATIGGHPVSHFQLTRAARAASASNDAATAAAGALDGPAVNAGTANYIGKFQNTVDLVNSTLYENAGRIGLGTTTPLDFLHVRFSDGAGGVTGLAVQNTSSAANAYSGMLFYDHTGALGQFQGFNNTTKQYRINNVASGGSINFMLASTSRFFIGAAGIGLGTTSPGAPLHVVGAVRTDAQYNLGANRILSTPGTGNLLVGVQAGPATPTGSQNTFVGAQAGTATTTGSTNTFVGEQAGQTNIAGSGNTFVGESAGLVATASNNTFVGQGAGRAVTSATGNTFLGQNAGAVATTAADNTFLGQGAGAATTLGGQNTFVGAAAGAGNSTGTNNTLVGQDAGISNASGSFNTFVGDLAGNSNTLGSSNTLIGQAANVSFGNLTNAAAIGARATVAQSNSIILGAINGLNGATADTRVGIGITAPTDPLHVVGDIRIGSGTTGCVKDADGTAIAGTCASDLRFKADVQPFGRLLDRVARLRPVTFYWKQAEFPDKHFGAAQSFGLIAQEVEQVLPELVVHDATGYRAVNYSRLPLVTLQAVTDLAAENEALRRDNEALRAAQAALKARLDAIEQALGAAVRTPGR